MLILQRLLILSAAELNFVVANILTPILDAWDRLSDDERSLPVEQSARLADRS